MRRCYGVRRGLRSFHPCLQTHHKNLSRNQNEFHTIIHQALRGLCQGGLLGDAEMLLFYAFRDPQNADLQAGTQVLVFYCINFVADETELLVSMDI